jgi:hypothetical protein
MALSATLAELETWIRQDADMQAPDDRVTSEECRNRINRSLAQLYDRLVLVDQEYFLKSATVASTGAGTYDIMNDLATGVVRSISSVYATGSGYINGATVTLSQGANASATATITASGGAITGVTLTSSGFGYVDAAQTSAGWILQSTVTPPSVQFTGPPVIVGTDAFVATAPIGGPDSYVYKIDLLTGAFASSAALPAVANPLMAYESSSGQLVVALYDGSLAFVNTTTLTFSIQPVVASFISNGLLIDDTGPYIYVATSSDIYQLDSTGTIISTFTPGVVIAALLAMREQSGQKYLIYQDSSGSDNLYQVDAPLFASPTLLSATIGSVASVVHVPSSDKLLISFSTGECYQYDYGTASLSDITNTLTSVPGYAQGPSFLTYDVTNDRVWVGSFLQSTTSNTVVALSGTSLSVDTYFSTPVAANIWVAAFGTSVIVSGYPFFVGPPASQAFYIYNYGSSSQSVPNYIVLNVSGGTGGQVIAYIESDFYKCKGVWFSTSGSEPDNGDWTPLRRFNWEQQNALNQSALYDGLRALPLYRIITEGNRDKLVISPDQLSGSYKLWYYPAPTRLLTDTDRFDGRAGWDEWIVKDVAIQLLMAEESVEQAATLKNVRDEIWQRIQLHAEDREAAQPQRIMDATLLSRRYGPRWGR